MNNNSDDMSLVNGLKLSAEWYDYASWIVPIWGASWSRSWEWNLL